MPSARYRSRFSRGRAKPQYRWETFTTQPTVLPAGNVNFINMNSGVRDAADGDGRKGLVVERMLGTLSIQPETASANTELAAGITPLSNQALAGLDFPLPGSAAGHSWMWWVFRVLAQGALQATAQIDIDVKSKRVFRDTDSEVVFVMENTDAVHGFTWSLGLRVLFKLP